MPIVQYDAGDMESEKNDPAVDPESIERSSLPKPGTELQKEALRLHRAGKNNPEIGEILGFSKQRAYTIVQRALEAEKKGLLALD